MVTLLAAAIGERNAEQAELGWAAREKTSRAVAFTPAGRRRFESLFPVK